MRYLGIDFGEKHIGVAISDEGGVMAFPHATFDNNAQLFARLEEAIKEKGVSEIIIGESKNYAGKENPVMEKAHVFAKQLAEKTGLSVHFEPEFMTSMEARHIQGGGDKTHASAAALILKSYLDRKNN
jgi:putative Holliday junction resolvase